MKLDVPVEEQVEINIILRKRSEAYSSTTIPSRTEQQRPLNVNWYSYSYFHMNELLTCGGETSGMITKGTGPRPIANDLELEVNKGNRNAKAESHVMNVSMLMLESKDAPVSKPNPTRRSEIIAPVIDVRSRNLRPIRYKQLESAIDEKGR